MREQRCFSEDVTDTLYLHSKNMEILCESSPTNRSVMYSGRYDPVKVNNFDINPIGNNKFAKINDYV